nr:hypothetical protein [Tanacetum cinerariifolium]
QHEAHANENKMMLDRFTQHIVDPLALMSNVSNQQHYSQLSLTPPSIYVPPHLADNAHLDLDNVFQADDCDAFDFDVDEAPTAQTMFMANLSSVDPVYDEVGPSYDSYILPKETLAEGTEGAPYLGLPKDIYTLINHYTDANDIWDNVKMLLEGFELTKEDRESQLNQATIQDGRVVVQNVQGRPNKGQGMNPWGGNAAGYGEAQNRVRNVNQGQARPGQARTAQENGVALDAEQLLFLAGGPDNTFDDDVDEQPVQDLALNVDNVFQAKDYDAFDSDVDEAPTAQTMFIANLSSAYPITDKAGPSYDYDILSEVQDYDQYLDETCAYQEEHVMHDSVQLNHVVDLHADYTSVDNMILYDQYVKDNDVPVVHSNASSVQNDTFMMIYNEMCEPFASNLSQNTVAKNSLTAELATYREQVELNKLNCMKDGLDFKQKENKYLEDFLDMKSLKENVKDRSFKQDQSLQAVHMLCRQKPYYKELNTVAIGYKNPLCLTHAKQVQLALYNGHEIIKDNHVPAIVHNTEDTLEIAEITRRKIFWSQYLIKMKTKALKEQTTTSRPIKALTVNIFEGIQKDLTKEIKEMKVVFEELEAELLELMLLKRPKENTKCVNAGGEELTAAKHKLKLLV